jgi:hypothetical protein
MVGWSSGKCLYAIINVLNDLFANWETIPWIFYLNLGVIGTIAPSCE